MNRNIKSKLFLTTAIAAVANAVVGPAALAQTYGIHHTSSATLVVQNGVDGTIAGEKSGIFGQEGPIAVDNAGTIRGNGTYDGLAAEPDSGIVLAIENSSIVNSGTISGAGLGISTSHYYNATTDSLEPRAIGTTITNSGTITGETNDGIRLIGGGTITNSGTVQGLAGAGTDGISMFALTGQDTSGESAIGTIINATGGTISGQRFGVILTGGAVIENAGTIDGGVGALLLQAQDSEQGKTATVVNSGTLAGAQGVGLLGALASADITNSGTIEGTGDFGVYNGAAAPLTLTNAASGEIVGAKIGVFSEAGALILNNAGTIRGDGSYDGFDAPPEGGVTISQGGSSVTNSGTISGAGTGITTAHFFNPETSSLEALAIGTTVANTGIITGETNDAIRLIGGGTITNSGSIQGIAGAGTDGISMFALTGQDTSGESSIGTVVNAADGVISGARFGIILSGGGTVENIGTISGDVGAVVIQNGTGLGGKSATLANSGTLDGGVILNTDANSLVNTGTISSGTGAAIAAFGATTVDNAGILAGTDGIAVQFSASNDTLILRNGSSVTGAIDGGEGLDTATLIGASAVATDAQTIAELANFEHLNVDQGYWTAAGPVGAFGEVMIGADGVLAVHELVTDSGSDSPIATASIVNDGLLVLDFDTTETLTGFDGLTISGTGGVRLEGAGVFQADGGDLTYTGTTTIANGGLLLTGTLAGDIVTSGDGTFQLGDGGTAGEFSGDLVNDGTFIFARSDDFDFLGAFSGTGDFAKMGDGTLTFAGDYSYTGLTRILGGTVRFAGEIDPSTEIDVGSGTFDISGSPQTIAALSGGAGSSIVVNDSRLTVEQDEDSQYAGGITGDGSLVKDGDGRLNLTGDSDYSGPTAVNGGTLSVNGSIASNVTVNAGGTLGGTGTIGGVTVAGDGTFAPGNSIGTIAVAGDVAFASGSIYEVEVDAAGAADRIDAAGSATIADGSGVQVLAENGTYRPVTDYTILTAQGGVAGTFTTVTTNLAFLTPTLGYSANAVTLTLRRNDIDFAAVAASFNQASTGAAVQALGVGNPLFEDVLIQNEAGARAAFDILSGEIHASVSSALTSDSRHVRDALLEASQAQGAGMRIWGSALGSWGEVNARDAVAALETDHRGLITGFDVAGESFAAGLAAGIASSDYKADARGSSADVDTKFVGGHVGYKAGSFGVKIGGAIAWHDIDTARAVGFATIAQSPAASYDATTRQIFGEISYDIAVSDVSLSPFARLAHVRTSTDGFAEVTGSAALTVAKGIQTVELLSLGVHARGIGGAIQPRLSLAWQHGWGDLTGESSARFAGSTDSFRVVGSRLPRNAATVDAGVDVELGQVTLGASYIGSLSSDWSDHGARATLSLKF